MEAGMKHFSLDVDGEEGIYKAMDITETMAEEMGFLSKEKLFLKLVTEEACMNAYEYCQSIQQRRFRISWFIKRKYLEICVKHKGEHFKIEVPTEVNKSGRGRGLQLITHIMDKVQVKVDGEYVELSMRKVSY